MDYSIFKPRRPTMIESLSGRASNLPKASWTPPREQIDAGEWERCHCDCHRRPGQVKHVAACCQGGWKQTYKGRMNARKRKEATA